MKKKDSNVMDTGKDTPWVLLLGVFLTSVSVLTLEITFTRILSVVLSYHYVFIVVSMALLGLGGGGVFVYLIRRGKMAPEGSGPLAILASLFSLSIPLSMIAVTRTTYDSNVFLFGFLILIPFFVAGVILSSVLQRFAYQSPKIYGVDLLGAAAGSLLVIPLLNSLGAINSIFIVSFLAAGASLLFAIEATRKKIWVPAVNSILVVSLFLVNLANPNLASVPIGQDPDKDISGFLHEGGGKIAETRWSFFGRTDLVQNEGSAGQMVLFLDGNAGTPMYEFNGDPADPGPRLEQLKATFLGYFPFRFLEEGAKENALIIGPGGGRDVLLALMAGVRQITAVEVNGDLVDLVKKYSSYNGGIYTDFPNVAVVVDEGRSFLRRQKGKFDIIMLTLPVTRSSRSPGGFALTENFLFTKESLGEYWDHLTDQGRLIVVAHGNTEVAKLLSLSLTALEERGIQGKAAMNYLYAINMSRYSLFVLNKTGVQPEESYLMHEALHASTSHQRLDLYFPYVKPGSCKSHEEQNRPDECQMVSPVFMAISGREMSIEDFVSTGAKEDVDVSVVSDNRPFFYNFEPGVPVSLYSAFWISIAFVLICISLPLLLRKRKKKSPSRRKRDKQEDQSASPFTSILLFSMLGLGFMMAEISLIQRFALFLGEPVLSFTVLLFSLLIGAGIGSLLTTRVTSRQISKAIFGSCASISVLLPTYAFFVPPIFSQLLGLSLPLRVLVSVGLVVPLGFLLGLPFPLGMRLLKQRNIERYVPWIWGVNGAASVLGSVAAVGLAMMFGFAQVLLISAVCYVFASLSALLEGKKEDTLRSPLPAASLDAKPL